MKKLLLIIICFTFFFSILSGQAGKDFRAKTVKKDSLYQVESERYSLTGGESFTLIMELPEDASIQSATEIKTLALYGIKKPPRNPFRDNADIHWYPVPAGKLAPNMLIRQRINMEKDGQIIVEIRFQNQTKTLDLYVKAQATYPARTNYSSKEINTYILNRSPETSLPTPAGLKPFIGSSPNKPGSCLVCGEEQWLFNPTNSSKMLAIKEKRNGGYSGVASVWDYQRTLYITLPAKSQKFMGCTRTGKRPDARCVLHLEWQLINYKDSSL